MNRLNNKYRDALSDKVIYYQQLVEALKQLVERQTQFVKNEVEICQITNETKVIRLELSQKELFMAELSKGKDSSQMTYKIEQLKKIR